MPQPIATTKTLSTHKLAFNADIAAIAIALTLAVLIRLDLLPHITW